MSQEPSGTAPAPPIRSRRRSRRGTTAVEYGLIASTMFLVLLGAAYQLHESVRDMWLAISGSMPT